MKTPKYPTRQPQIESKIENVHLIFDFLVEKFLIHFNLKVFLICSAFFSLAIFHRMSEGLYSVEEILMAGIKNI